MSLISHLQKKDVKSKNLIVFTGKEDKIVSGVIEKGFIFKTQNKHVSSNILVTDSTCSSSALFGMVIAMFSLTHAFLARSQKCM